MIARCYGTGLLYMLAKRSYANSTSLLDLFVFNVKLSTFYIPSFTHCAPVHPFINLSEEACFLFSLFAL